MQFWRILNSSSRTALLYVTIGDLILVWTGLWCLFLINDPPAAESGLFSVVSVFALSGLLLVCIGLTYAYRFAASLPRDDLLTTTVVDPVAPRFPAVPAVHVIPEVLTENVAPLRVDAGRPHRWRRSARGLTQNKRGTHSTFKRVPDNS